ncbi:MAG: hypothetical protein WCJ87_02995 [Burkholderiales bacterium]
MPRTTFVTFVVPLVLSLAACGRPTEQATPAVAASGPTSETELRGDIQKLTWAVALLKTRVSALESGDATISTEDQGYDVARTKFGPFTVSVRGVTPYLDGHKVKIRIGNLTNASFDDPKLKLSWGPAFDAEKPDDWEKNQKKREVSLTESLLSGSFTDVEVILTPSKPEDIKSISVGFELDKLKLRVR